MASVALISSTLQINVYVVCVCDQCIIFHICAAIFFALCLRTVQFSLRLNMWVTKSRYSCVKIKLYVHMLRCCCCCCCCFGLFHFPTWNGNVGCQQNEWSTCIDSSIFNKFQTFNNVCFTFGYIYFFFFIFFCLIAVCIVRSIFF